MTFYLKLIIFNYQQDPKEQAYGGNMLYTKYSTHTIHFFLFFSIVLPYKIGILQNVVARYRQIDMFFYTEIENKKTNPN
jgi:hypothetical protein